ncbi:Uu.00g015800.m01.CDS01 [Anthostomella pinea]|uniref:Uu.00g015800.m01.CDS01 n=1 Tax=Anthostomella pinea TaxID=933095 RepID=A0AAI8YQJ0_9PEZI|nr:Uu.00g015800.m01.CDS01 [Anthostomella pinea]
MYRPTPPPPVPPPKPSSHDTSRLGTPAITNSPRPPPPIPDHGFNCMESKGKAPATDASGLIPAPMGHAQTQPIPDPGEQWLPKVLEDKSKQDLAEILSNPELLNALTVSPSTIHPSLAATQDALLAALNDNVGLASHLTELETRLAHQRAATQAQLLSTHALERQWRAKQSEMDRALAPFSPAALYQRLGRGLQEQEMMCVALEESFLEGDGADENGATERETLEWVRRYREAKRLYYLRAERRERWNERRVGGWR